MVRPPCVPVPSELTWSKPCSWPQPLSGSAASSKALELSVVPSQLSSMLLQVSAVGEPGVQLASPPFRQMGAERWQAPCPHDCEPGLTLVHAPAVVPVQVPAVGSWQVSSQVRVTGPAAAWAVHSSATLRQARSPPQVAAAAFTSALRKHRSPEKPAKKPTQLTAPHSASGSCPSGTAKQ